MQPGTSSSNLHRSSLALYILESSSVARAETSDLEINASLIFHSLTSSHEQSIPGLVGISRALTNICDALIQTFSSKGGTMIPVGPLVFTTVHSVDDPDFSWSPLYPCVASVAVMLAQAAAHGLDPETVSLLELRAQYGQHLRRGRAMWQCGSFWACHTPDVCSLAPMTLQLAQVQEQPGCYPVTYVARRGPVTSSSYVVYRNAQLVISSSAKPWIDFEAASVIAEVPLVEGPPADHHRLHLAQQFATLTCPAFSWMGSAWQ